MNTRTIMSRSKKTILGGALPKIPWEERPRNCRDVVWRYSRNPVIPRDLIPRANSIFNSAVVSFGKSFAGVFRVDDATRTTRIHNDYVSSP
jgi:beta-1,4-mannooligosaccharide/beta-1,4-mannosyl-N-acetylglucosamine phosphorylase